MPQPAESSQPDQARFSPEFAQSLRELFQWRRDVRSFKTDLVSSSLVDSLLRDAARGAPSVGLSQPARFVCVETVSVRQALCENFKAANARALAGYQGERAKLYASLKLSGMVEAPVQISAFCDEGTHQGSGLGSATMPETLRYSVVCAIMQFWLAARAAGLGLGWVSILDPEALASVLGTHRDWVFVGHLCVGWPKNEQLEPELERVGWEARRCGEDCISRV